MGRLLRYFRGLNQARTILWCYLIWYCLHVAIHFDPHPRLWLNALGISAIVGTALVLSTRGSGGPAKPGPWALFRLYLMPFCVSSFAALVKDAGFILVFPPALQENLLGFGAIAVFLLFVFALKKTAAH
ncbi:MAG: hypothetical protein FJW39_28150 [Acidobacteria bacterium]|nr:hypothetical protein [Acidobacteriota bacterium]